MNNHPAFVVYSHLTPFMRNRGLSTPVPLNESSYTFCQNLKLFNVFKLITLNSQNQYVIIIILAADSKYTEHGPQLRILIDSFHVDKYKHKLEEIIIIAPEECIKKKNIIQVVKHFQDRRSEGAKYYTMVAYYIFAINHPAAQMQPKLFILDKLECDQLLTKHHIPRLSLPYIFANDPLCVWYGARAGDVVKLIALSDTVGEDISYRFVIEGRKMLME